MVQAYYTYRIRITSSDTVQIEKYDVRNNDLGQPSGRFGYRGKIKARIQELHQTARRGELVDSAVQELGEKLFEVLFGDKLQHDFFTFHQDVLRKHALLRIELDVDEHHLPEIAALPWEFMRVPTDKGYTTFWLSTNPFLIFSRRRSQWAAPEPIQLEEGERLRIALAVAAPNGLDPVKDETIWNELQDWAKEQAQRIELLELIKPATPSLIDEVLKQRPHIFHFIGHGRIRNEGQDDVRQIALVDHPKLNNPLWHDAREFSELFDRHQPGVVLLQTCEGATPSDSEAFVGVASHVVQQNIPVVVAMQYEVSNATAQSFALEFYERLAQNDPVDKAAQEGRRRISLGPVRYTRRDFATPVLFMRVRNGQLFLSSALESGDETRTYSYPYINSLHTEDITTTAKPQGPLQLLRTSEQISFSPGEPLHQDSNFVLPPSRSDNTTSEPSQDDSPQNYIAKASTLVKEAEVPFRERGDIRPVQYRKAIKSLITTKELLQKFRELLDTPSHLPTVIRLNSEQLIVEVNRTIEQVGELISSIEDASTTRYDIRRRFTALISTLEALDMLVRGESSL